MTLHRTTRTRITALALAAVLALSACDDASLPDAPAAGPTTTLASGDPVDSSGGSALGSATGEQDVVVVQGANETDAADTETAGADTVESGEAEVDPATDPASTDAEPAEAPAQDPATGGDCLVGAWVFSTAEMNAYYDQLEFDGVTFDVTGDVRIELRADNTFDYTPTFGFTMTIDGLSATGETSGSATGTYSAVDGHFTFMPEEDTIDFTMSMAGISMSASELGIETLGLGAAGTSYSCDNGVPVFQYQTHDGTHPVALERA